MSIQLSVDVSPASIAAFVGPADPNVDPDYYFPELSPTEERSRFDGYIKAAEDEDKNDPVFDTSALPRYVKEVSHHHASRPSFIHWKPNAQIT